MRSGGPRSAKAQRLQVWSVSARSAAVPVAGSTSVSISDAGQSAMLRSPATLGTGRQSAAKGYG